MYWKEKNFKAIKKIQKAIKIAYPDNSVSLAEASIRWLIHHSKLDIKCGDAIILGSSNITQLTENLDACKEDTLDQQVVQEIDHAWQTCCCSCSH